MTRPFLLLTILILTIFNVSSQDASNQITLEQANRLAALPLACIQVEYPNKLNQTLGASDDIQSPKTLHPTFYGCFDWHSSVRGH